MRRSALALRSGSNFGDESFFIRAQRVSGMTILAKEEHALRDGQDSRLVFQRGCTTSSAGNLSLLLPDGNILATPTGSCLGNLDRSGYQGNGPARRMAQRR